jgi:hypothetical protein
MTVQELIDKLEAIKDKEKPVVLVEWSVGNPLMAKYDLTTNRISNQAHRVAIIMD